MKTTPISRQELLSKHDLTEFETTASSKQRLASRLNNLPEVALANRYIIIQVSNNDDLEDLKREALRLGYGYEFTPYYESPRCGNGNPAQVKIYW